MTDYSDGHARALEDILEDLSAGRSTVQEAAEWIRRQSPQMLHRPVKRRPRSIGIVITTVGLMFLVMAGVVGAQSYSFMTSGIKAQATVTEMIPRDRVHVPRYAYIVDGTTYTGAGNVGTSPPSYRVGDTIAIEYLPDQPANSRIATWAERWTGTLALSVMGGVVTVIGGVIVLISRRPWTGSERTVDAVAFSVASVRSVVPFAGETDLCKWQDSNAESPTAFAIGLPESGCRVEVARRVDVAARRAAIASCKARPLG